MPKKSTSTSGRLNFHVTKTLHERLLRFTLEEGHPDVSEACRYILNSAMAERYGRPITIYRVEKEPVTIVADAPTQNAP